MGVLVIGDDFRGQLDRYQRAERADPMSKHMRSVDILDSARRAYARWPYPEKRSLADWAGMSYGISVLADGQEPDLRGLHRQGWFRLTPDGQVCEMVERTIPGGFLDFFSGAPPAWHLKHGAQGVVVRSDGKEEPAIDGFAGSARKGDIDFAGMREAIRKAAAYRWDCAAAASDSRTWTLFEAIWDRHRAEKFSETDRRAALKEWSEQPAVYAISKASNLDRSRLKRMSRLEAEATVIGGLWNNSSHEAIDPLRLPRQQYVERFRLRSLLHYSEIIREGEQLGHVNTTGADDA